MASYKVTSALIFIVQLVATLSAARKNNQIVPEGQLFNGHGTVIGVRAPPGIDHVVNVDAVSVRARRFRTVQHEQTFHTREQETITQIRVEDPTMRVTGGRVEVISNGPGSQNVTLKFISKWNSGINKVVALYGHH